MPGNKKMERTKNRNLIKKRRMTLSSLCRLRKTLLKKL